MRPFAAINAIVFGSAAAITFGLVAVVIIFLVLKGEHPRFGTELGPLLRSSAIFAVLSLSSGTSLYATLKELRWRWIAQAGMWLTLAAVIALYWPD
ncbi:MAG TPA: hypothetical protein VLT59_16875 [Steroidobacteraceae bacterium]|nr:hypothetical protein [Steroidobacteraceae bacterium]